MVLVVLVASACTVATDSAGRVPANCFEGTAWETGADAVVYLSPDTTALEIAALETSIATAPEVTAFSFTDQVIAFEQFQSMFADQENMLDAVTVDDMPPYFSLELVDPPSETFLQLRDRLGFGSAPVFETQTRPNECPPTQEEIATRCDGKRLTGIVFLNPDATDAEIDRVRSELDASDLPISYEYVDQAAAYRTFRRDFADEPAVLAEVSASDMPPNFEIESDQEIGPLLRSFRGTPGIFEVIDDGCSTLNDPP